MDIEAFTKNLVDYVPKDIFLDTIRSGAWIIVFDDGKVSYINAGQPYNVGDTFGTIYYHSYAKIVEIDPHNKILWAEKTNETPDILEQYRNGH